jgi:mRNA-degrading endonuclease RelE of RelBE toxin-antitoxin system
MTFRIVFTDSAKAVYEKLQATDPPKCNKVKKTLGQMESNIRHPSLHTHEYQELRGPNKEKVFEAYVENKTPAAYRIFWYYGPAKDMITIVQITPHP